VRDGKLLHNGRPLMIRGVCRHEWDPRTGKVSMLCCRCATLKQQRKQRREWCALMSGTCMRTKCQCQAMGVQH